MTTKQIKDDLHAMHCDGYVNYTRTLLREQAEHTLGIMQGLSSLLASKGAVNIDTDTYNKLNHVYMELIKVYDIDCNLRETLK